MPKRLLKESVVYGLSSTIARFIGVFTLPIYSQVLSTEDYGTIGIFNTTFNFLLFLLVFSMDSAAVRFYYIHQQNQKKPLVNWFYFQLITTFVFCVIIFIFSNSALKILFSSLGTTYYLWILASYLLLNILPNIVTNQLRIHKKPWHVFSLSIATVMLNVGLTLYFVVYQKMGAIGYLKAQLFSFLFSNLISGYFFRDLLFQWRWIDFALMRDMLRYSYPILLSLMALQLQNFLVAQFLEKKIGMSLAGLYYMANTLASFITIISSSFSQAFGPYSFEVYHKKEDPKIYATVYHFYVMGIVVVASSIFLFSSEILHIFIDAKFHDAMFTLGLLLFYLVFSSYSVFSILGSNLKNKNQTYLIATIASLIAFIACGWWMVPLWGIEGLASSMICSQVILNVVAFYLSHRHYAIPFAVISSILWTLGILALTFSMVWFFPNPYQGFVLKIIFFIIHCIFAGMVGYFLLKKEANINLLSKFKLK
jgi:O-antigen/teichoic acid export membrane protein